MDRKEFLKVCGGACFSVLGISLLAGSCAPGPMVQGTVEKEEMIVDVKSFEIVKKGQLTGYRKYLIAQNDALNYPLVVYRQDATTYTSLLLRCTHQGAELSVHGDLISCPAHGSEFAPDGSVIQGPADAALKTFNVRLDGTKLYIQLV